MHRALNLAVRFFAHSPRAVVALHRLTFGASLCRLVRLWRLA